MANRRFPVSTLFCLLAATLAFPAPLHPADNKNTFHLFGPSRHSHLHKRQAFELSGDFRCAQDQMDCMSGLGDSPFSRAWMDAIEQGVPIQITNTTAEETCSALRRTRQCLTDIGPCPYGFNATLRLASTDFVCGSRGQQDLQDLQGATCSRDPFSTQSYQLCMQQNDPNTFGSQSGNNETEQTDLPALHVQLTFDFCGYQRADLLCTVESFNRECGTAMGSFYREITNPTLPPPCRLQQPST